MRSFNDSMRRLGLAAGAGLALCFTVGSAHAAAVTVQHDLDFLAPTQSIWGPGKSFLDWGTSGFLGSTSLGIEYSAQASTGTVKVDYNGRLTTSYDSKANGTRTLMLDVSFLGDSNGGKVDSLLGADAHVDGWVLGVKFDIYDVGYSLDVDKNFTPVIDMTVTGNDSFTGASGSVGPNIVVASATAGVDLDVSQDVNFTGTEITGVLMAKHRDSGLMTMTSLLLDTAANETLTLGLFKGGYWDLKYVSLDLDSAFFTEFFLDLVPFVQYTIGLGCGDPGDDGDNGILCGGDGRADFTLLSVPLFESATFALAFDDIAATSEFSVFIVPEPGSLLLFGVGLAGLGLIRRRRRQAA